jgi:hypothetical protein
MNLIGFHRVLIVTAAVFFFGYGLWEFAAFARGGGAPRLLFSGAAIAVAVLCVLYLRRLRRILGIRD